MDTDRYDIFLSYRRQGGFETAKHLYDLLTRDGYSVSFDIDTLRSGEFDTTLLRRIDQCTDFILILNKEAFDRTLDPTFDRNKDWMRIELAYALEKGKNIIPVMLSGFTEFPDELPADIAAVRRKNGPKYDQYYFDAFYAKLLRFLDSRPTERQSAAPSGGAAAGCSTLKIQCDMDCRILVDDEERGIAHAGRLFRLPLRGGSYILQFVSVENPADTVGETLHIEKDVEELYSVELLPVKRQREEREKREAAARAAEEKRRRREAYLLQLPDERFKAVNDNGAYGFLDSDNNELLIPFAYDNVGSFSEGLAWVKKDGKYGYIDKTDRTVIPFTYAHAGSFSESLAPVMKGWTWGYIDKTCKTAVSFSYDYAASFCNGLARVKKEGKWGYIDKTGKAVVPTIYDFAEDFNEDLALVKKDGIWSYIDKSGKAVVPLIYHIVDDFSEGLVPVERDGKWGYIDQSDRAVIPFTYDYAWPFSEGLAKVEKGGKYGYIDKTGKAVVPTIYDFAEDFNEDLALVRNDWKWGYIDKMGKTMIPLMYDDGWAFREGLAKVKKEGKWGYIDKTGRWVEDA